MDKNQKYDLHAIPQINRNEPFLVRTCDNVILRRDEMGDFILLDQKQDNMIVLCNQGARELAISILNSTLY